MHIWESRIFPQQEPVMPNPEKPQNRDLEAPSGAPAPRPASLESSMLDLPNAYQRSRNVAENTRLETMSRLAPVTTDWLAEQLRKKGRPLAIEGNGYMGRRGCMTIKAAIWNRMSQLRNCGVVEQRALPEFRPRYTLHGVILWHSTCQHRPYVRKPAVSKRLPRRKPRHPRITTLGLARYRRHCTPRLALAQT